MAGHAGRQAAALFHAYGWPAFAGLWDEWTDRATGEKLKSCTMIITEPNAMVSEVHDRMPVVLEEKTFTPWLENEAGLEVLKLAEEGMLQRWPVSKRVDSSKADQKDETLTALVEVAAPQFV